MESRVSQRKAEVNSYVQNFVVAQMNLNQLILEERLRRRINRNKSGAKNEMIHAPF